MRTPHSLVSRLNSLIIAGLLTILLIGVAVPLHTARSSSLPAESNSSGVNASLGKHPLVIELPRSNIGLVTSGFLPAFEPPPGVETIETFDGVPCSTPKTVFTLGEVVCAKITNAPLGSRPTQILRRLNIANPGGIILSKANVTADPQTLTFTLPSTPTSIFGGITVDNRGSWEVNSVSTATGGVTTSASFQVTDPANAVADLSLNAYVFGSGTVPAGDDVTFAVYVINYGPDAAANVEVTVDVPANTTFASETHTNLGFTCVNPEDGSPGTSTCTIASLPRGSTVLFDFTYHVSGGASPGSQILHTSNISTTTAQRATGANTANAEAVVTQADAAEECTVTCPTDRVVTANATQAGQEGAVVTYSAASVFGNCGAVTNSPGSGSFLTVTGSPHTITSTATAGPSCTFTVTVLSSTPPTITCPPNMTVTAPTGEQEATVNPGLPTHTASGGGETVVGVRTDGTPAVYDEDGVLVTPAVVVPLTDPYPVGTTGIFWTVTDAGGRSASCSQTITVIAVARDPLTISCPANVTATASGSCETTVTLGTPTTNPSDTHVTYVGVRSDGQPLSDPFPAGVTQVTWTATDDVNDSVATCTQSVTVSGTDSISPTLTLPGNINVTTSSCSETLDDELGVAIAEDNCTPSVNVSRTGVPANFVFPTGTTVITYTATDAAGNTATGTQSVTVLESTPPTITAPASLLTLNTGGAGGASCGTFVGDATLGSATANDNCPGVTVARSGVPAGNNFPVGDTTITYTSTDASGNTAQAFQTVRVADNTPPLITAPANASYQCPSQVPAANASQATASDNCGTPTVTVSETSNGGIGSTASPLVITRTFTATDAAMPTHNSASAIQTITVIDNTPPVITCPADIIADFDPAVNGAVVAYIAPVGSDNCSGVTTTQIAGQLSGSTFPVGTTVNTFRATDAAGNITECSFKVTVALTSIIGLDSVTITGSGYADSYNSTGGYPATKGSLANILSNGTITIGNSGKVWGNVRSTSAGVNMTGSAHVTGNATAGTNVTTSGSATVGGTRTNNAPVPAITLPSVPVCGPPYSTNSGITGNYAYSASTGNLTVSGSNIATLANGTYCFNNLTLGNSGELKVNGPVVIKLTGTLNLSGSAKVNNTTQIPSNLRILSSRSGGNGIVLGNSASTYAVIYAPNTGLNISGSAPLFGTVAGKTITIGNSGAIHYDTQLKAIWPAVWALIVGP